MKSEDSYSLMICFNKPIIQKFSIVKCSQYDTSKAFLLDFQVFYPLNNSMRVTTLAEFWKCLFEILNKVSCRKNLFT
jgi:hypothetical protein